MSMIRIHLDNIDYLAHKQKKLIDNISDNRSNIHKSRNKLDTEISGRDGSYGVSIDKTLSEVDARLGIIYDNMEKIADIKSHFDEQFGELETVYSKTGAVL